MNNTNKMDYWIYTSNYGFKFFNQESDYFDFLKKNSFIFKSLNYKFGFDFIRHTHNENSLQQKIDIVLSHPINIKKLNKKRKNIGRKYRKGFSYRIIKTTQEKKRFFDIEYSEKEILNEYNIRIKGARNANILPSYYDDICAKIENNWKSKKQRKQWMSI